MIKEIFNDFIKVIFVLLLIVLAVMILWKIIYGGSDPLIVGLLLANLGYSWLISNQLQRHIGEHEGYKKGLADGREGEKIKKVFK